MNEKTSLEATSAIQFCVRSIEKLFKGILAQELPPENPIQRNRLFLLQEQLRGMQLGLTPEVMSVDLLGNGVHSIRIEAIGRRRGDRRSRQRRGQQILRSADSSVINFWCFAYLDNAKWGFKRMLVYVATTPPKIYSRGSITWDIGNLQLSDFSKLIS